MGRVAIGIDVGGANRGFHAAVIVGIDVIRKHAREVNEIVDWCESKYPAAIAIDSPCKWSTDASSRRCERELHYDGRIIQCFKTPTRKTADRSDFYQWVRNGELLYKALEKRLPGCKIIETFPFAIHCYLEGTIDPRKGLSKVKSRRASLARLGYDVTELTNIDFVDAGLCAHVAKLFLEGNTVSFGDDAEGYIYVPKPSTQRR